MKKISLTVAMTLLVLGFVFTAILVPQAHAQSYSRSTTTSLGPSAEIRPKIGQRNEE